MLDLEQRLEDGKEPAVKTIDRAARVLRVLASGGQNGMALRDVATACEFGKPTAHRLLAALIDAGFAFQDIETRRYRLGAGLSMLAHAANQQHVGGLAQPAIRRIADVTLDTVYASVREGHCRRVRRPRDGIVPDPHADAGGRRPPAARRRLRRARAARLPA